MANSSLKEISKYAGQNYLLSTK